MDVQLFNKGHLILLGTTLAVMTVFLVVFFLIRKNRKLTYWLIAGLFLAGLVVHFLRLAVPPPGRDFPYAYTYITPMGVCAFNAMAFPFIFLFTKSKTLRDYMFYIGIATGILALLTPMTAYNKPALSFDAIRFFVIHGLLCLAPLLMVLCGHHKLNWRRVWQPVFVLTGVMCIILVNEIVLFSIGIVGEPYTLEGIIKNQHQSRNGAMIFGPPEDAGVYGKMLTALCPSIFKIALFDVPSLGISAGDTIYWPIVWLLIPGFIYVTILCFVICLLFSFKPFWRDMRVVWYTLTGQRDKLGCDCGKKLSQINTKL